MDRLFIPRFADLAEALTTTLLHFVWQGSVLAVLLILTVKLLGIRSIRVRYLLSVGTLVAMSLAPVITLSVHQRSTIPMPATLLAGYQSPIQNDGVGLAKRFHSDWQFAEHVAHRPEFQAIVLISWLAGVFVLGTRLLVGFGITLRIRANLNPVPETLELLARRLGQRMRVMAANRVFTSLRIGQAVAVGWIRPIVLIPAAWLTELTPEVLEAVIAHELAHIRRWDLWVNLLQHVIETLLFFHPAVWWLSNRIHLEREICCDELAADCLGRAAYARSLESVARMAAGNMLLAASIQGGMRMNLLNRIQCLLGTAPAETSSPWAAGFTAMTLPFLASAMFSFAFGSAPSIVEADEPTPVATTTTDAPNQRDKQNEPKTVQKTQYRTVLRTEYREIEVTVRKPTPHKVIKRIPYIKAEKVAFTIAASPEKASPTPSENISPKLTVGQIVGIEMTGEVGKEYARLASSIEAQDIFVETMGTVAEIRSDGRYRIELNSTIKRDGKSPQLVTVSAVIEPQKVQTKVTPKGTPIFSSPVDKNPTPTESDQTGFSINLSDLKGVKIQSWELKQQIGE